MNIPNILTVFRFVLTGYFVFFLYGQGIASRVAALFFFILACVTDYYDGRYARKYGQITFFGQLMDPIADKVLVFSAFLSFVQMGFIPAWMVLLMLTREVLITVFRFVAVAKHVALPAEKQGKRKTVLQTASVICILIALICAETSWWDPAWAQPAEAIIYVAVFAVTAFTLWSGLVYGVKYWKQAGSATAR